MIGHKPASSHAALLHLVRGQLRLMDATWPARIQTQPTGRAPLSLRWMRVGRTSAPVDHALFICVPHGDWPAAHGIINRTLLCTLVPAGALSQGARLR